MGNKKQIKVAVIDMNNGQPNLGISAILEILSDYGKDKELEISTAVFDLRNKLEIPDQNHHIYISSGGPGSPADSEGEEWEKLFFDLLDKLKIHNNISEDKKHVFLICHSFQLFCRKYGFGTLTKRKSNSFGIFPIELTAMGEADPIYAGLPNPFYAVDSRDWQVLNSKKAILNADGAELLALEKERVHVDLERCIMSIRFSKEFVGTQFHPEAHPAGVKEAIMNQFDEEKQQDMIENLENTDNIILTHQTILPNFLDEAIKPFIND